MDSMEKILEEQAPLKKWAGPVAFYCIITVNRPNQNQGMFNSNNNSKWQQHCNIFSSWTSSKEIKTLELIGNVPKFIRRSLILYVSLNCGLWLQATNAKLVLHPQNKFMQPKRSHKQRSQVPVSESALINVQPGTLQTWREKACFGLWRQHN